MRLCRALSKDKELYDRLAYISADMSERLDHLLAEHHRHRPERYLAVPQYSAVQATAGW